MPSPAAPSSGSPSTSAATPTSTLSAKPRPCWRGNKEAAITGVLRSWRLGLRLRRHARLGGARGASWEALERVIVGFIGKGRSDLFLWPANLHLREPNEDKPVGLRQGRLGRRARPQTVAEHHVDFCRPQRQLRAQVEPGQQGDDDGEDAVGGTGTPQPAGYGPGPYQ